MMVLVISGEGLRWKMEENIMSKMVMIWYLRGDYFPIALWEAP
jgi:hypothetical protein